MYHGAFLVEEPCSTCLSHTSNNKPSIEPTMPPTTIRTPPSADDYTPLEDFQSRTPETFVGGKPILHCHLVGAKASIPKSQGGKLAVFPADAGASETNGTNGDAEEPVIERQVDVFVNSEYVFHQARFTATETLTRSLSQKLHHLQQRSRIGRLDPLPLDIHTRRQAHRPCRDGGGAHTGRMDAARVQRRRQQRRR